MADLKIAASSFIPEEEKIFFQKWNRLKVSVSGLFNSFDELECIWDELKEESKTKETRVQNVAVQNKPPEVEKEEVGVQTDPIKKNEEPVLDWKSLVEETYNYNNEETTRKISIQSWSPSRSRSPTPDSLNSKLREINENKKPIQTEKISVVPEEEESQEENSQEPPSLDDIIPDLEEAPNSSIEEIPINEELFENSIVPKIEKETTPEKKEARKSIGLSKTLPVSSAPRTRKAEKRAKRKRADDQRENTTSKIQAKIGAREDFSRKTQVKRSRRIEDTIAQIRRTRDNSFLTSVSALSKRTGEPAASTRNGRPTPPPTPPANQAENCFTSYEMEIFNQVLHDQKAFAS
ncbi:Oidioi.mRNA.OKI2018_I69.XSR.g16847.t1.cds [Oikopleura dioica]|uniref:Oidioi.mRNA.OKI2018_I69.XSR.g16847.t1.cds n=1 Tax=Oikopleura dioica TaxID=34765 RepID=A0ABN7SMJ4_OIKDI|nr:Oidioi.mRNA.OKI2018_I69.XSR.g16847.t1.cds [Oikopleura dioica]